MRLHLRPPALALALALPLIATPAAADLSVGDDDAAGGSAETGAPVPGAPADAPAADIPAGEVATVPQAAPVEPEITVAEMPPDAATDAATPASAGPTGAPREEVTVRTTGGELLVVGVTWAEATDLADLTAAVRWRTGETWSGWTDLEILPASAEPEAAGERGGTEPLVVTGAEEVEARVTAPPGQLPTEPELMAVDPGQAVADGAAPLLSGGSGGGTGTAAGAAGTVRAATAAAGVPRIFTRADWGADESIRSWRPELGRVTGAVIHHSAGANGYSAAQVPAIIRGIYAFHAQGRGWGDIGYNVLVDRFGRAWEGRYGGLDNAIIGAHASGVNATTFGISVLGDYDKVAVPAAAFETVAQVVAWKFARHGISTAGTAVGLNGKPMPRVVGHRDVGSTACPGRFFYSRLGELRSRIAALQPTMPSYPPNDTVRLGGRDRYATAVAASRWANSRSSVVYVATGRDFPDALAGGPAATRKDAPVLLLHGNAIATDVRTELRRLRPTTIYVLGGPGVITDATVAQLRQYAGTVTRLAGADRYATAAQVARNGWAGTAGTVVLTSGDTYADALTGGAAAAVQGAPILLTARDGLPAATRSEIARLRPGRVVLVGGPGAIAEGTLQQVAAAAPGATIERVAGRDRYATAAAVTARFWPKGAGTAYFAAGGDFADAVSAVPAAGDAKAPLLLARTTCLDAPTSAALTALKARVKVVVGGTGVVPDAATRTRC
ncbi:cell wall-binding repeat-containing protein [Georgenia sp. TF02-10]|uniref:cell wall-binding repeat-containing protein n=1 Tax=Georgenia sp. TF02-10 TaxID=2917725 RepID=UPI001FA7DBF4|nr:cell wall-binding repeat-containing protein [Georgenia sp. TF02-10]UNX55740.1 cell wall-binding repeat-containing protein [Georgenia sp. TF02-10]